MRRIIVISVVVVATIAAIWISRGGDAPQVVASVPPGAEAPTATDPLRCDEPITIGVVTDMSGGLSLHGADLGRGTAIGLGYLSGSDPQSGADQLYVVDDCEVRLLVRDDQSDPAVAEIAARRLIDDEGAVLLIGSVSPGTTAVLRDLARERGVVLIATTDTPTGLDSAQFDPNTFMVAPSPYQDAMAICDYWIAENGTETFAQIAPDYPLGHRYAAAFRDACTVNGGAFVTADILVPAATNSFTELLVPASEAEVLLLTWTGGGLPQLVGDAVAGGAGEVSIPFPPNSLLPIFMADAIGTTSVTAYHYTAPDNPVNDYLVVAGGGLGVVPDLFDARGVDAVLLAVAGLRTAGGAIEADSLRAALEGLRFASSKGIVEVRGEDHISIQDMYVVRLINTDDPEQRFYELVSTIRPEPPCLLGAEFANRCADLQAGSLGN